jgi:DNA-binding MarR family transcriptional regulator
VDWSRIKIDMSTIGFKAPDELLDSLSTLSRSLRAAAAQEYAAFDVGNTHAKFLRHIGRQSRISQADLARATQTDPALTGRTIETLVERGWVRRTRSEEDRRQYVLELNAPGQRARARVEEARQRLARRVAGALDDRDVADFARIARKILAAIGGPEGG